MKSIVFDIRLNSLYSIRIPYTWQSALSYPLPPPSSIIGMLANALQRYKNDKHPIYYLEVIENEVIWANAKLLTPFIVKSYTTSAITKWEISLDGKSTNALQRQFGYSKNLRIVVVLKNENLIEGLKKSLMSTPLTCGDSESLVSIENEVKERDVKESKEKIIETEYPIPFNKDIRIIEGDGQVFLVHEKCKKKDKKLPLFNYLLPIREEKGIFYPSLVKAEILNGQVWKIENIGYIVKRE